MEGVTETVKIRRMQEDVVGVCTLFCYVQNLRLERQQQKLMKAACGYNRGHVKAIMMQAPGSRGAKR